MKNIKNIAILAGILTMLHACTEKELVPISTDSIAPGIVRNVQSESIPGGAVISYNIPDDEDLLYVKAVYELDNGKMSEVRSSLYNNTLTIEGFGSMDEREVTITCVDRSENESESVKTIIKPAQPSVHKVKESVKVLADFGGIAIQWTNTNNAALAFVLMAENDNNELELVETIYSGITNGNYSLRGFDETKRQFALVIRDKWNNYSDTVFASLKPLFEQKLDKDKFEKIILDNDHDWSAWGGKYEYAYDDNTKTFCHTWAGTGWPQYFTIDLGAVVRLSRVVIVQRQEEKRFHYAHGNLRLIDIYGMKETPDADGSFDRWIPLRVAPENGCVSIKPSEEGGTTSEDIEHLNNGDEYGFTIDDPAVRYIRLVVNETWAKTGFAHFAEITFYGQEIE